MRLSTASFVAALLILLGGTSLIRSQESGYLSQKLLLENTIQQRVTNAISKILDESLFVVDVKVELAFTSTGRKRGEGIQIDALLTEEIEELSCFAGFVGDY